MKKETGMFITLQRLLRASFAGPFLVMETQIDDPAPVKLPGTPTSGNVPIVIVF